MSEAAKKPVTQVRLFWAGGENEFFLGVNGLQELETKMDMGCMEIHQHIASGAARLDQLKDVIRLGLIGANEMKPTDAAKHVGQLFDQHPPSEFQLTALAVVAAALFGVSPEEKTDG